MKMEEITKAFRKNIETGKMLGLRTNGKPWWNIGIIRDIETNNPVAFCAYYEPTGGITAGLVKQNPEEIMNLPTDIGVIMASRMFSILLENEDKYIFEGLHIKFNNEQED